MKYKKNRSIITIGGMAVGIGVIVFLVSIGYGLQEMVISRVARLEELRQIDVVPQVGSQVKIDDETLSDIMAMSNVKKVLPLIAVAGRVDYQDSVIDVAVFGVTSDYLKETALKPTSGEIFESDELSMLIEEPAGQVAGVSTSADFIEKGVSIGQVSFQIYPDNWLKVRKEPSVDSVVLGYTRRVEGVSSGEEFWGDAYIDNENGSAGKDEDGLPVGIWIGSEVFLWEKGDCFVNEDLACEGGSYTPILDDDGVSQKTTVGYFAEIGMKTDTMEFEDITPSVLGVETSTESALLTSDQGTDDLEYTVDEDGYVKLTSDQSDRQNSVALEINLSDRAKKVAVVNRAFLNVLGVDEGDAVGKNFKVSFIVVGDLLSDKEKVESYPAEYEIVGVVADEDTPFFYVPFVDLRGLGIVNYSQLKVVTKGEGDVSLIRQQIEGMGFVTSSVTDTVDQIDRLFGTVKLVLLSIGLVALSVAALGMFNTMSVSLLERTREVGLMKAMGMRSHEVKELFLTESMIMGFFGGLLGIIIGVSVGNALSLILSFFSLTKGVGLVDISYLPIVFVIFIVALSLFVGLITGVYPARRSQKISALNALRYE